MVAAENAAFTTPMHAQAPRPSPVPAFVARARQISSDSDLDAQTLSRRKPLARSSFRRIWMEKALRVIQGTNPRDVTTAAVGLAPDLGPGRPRAAPGVTRAVNPCRHD